MTCEKCNGTGIIIRTERVLSDSERCNLLKPGDSKRVELCSCIRDSLAALESAMHERPAAPASEPATGVLGIFEALGELVDDATRPKPKKGPTT